MALTVTSPAFVNGGSISARYTCEGADISPELQWMGEPSQTRSFALIVDDPDGPDPSAPRMTWVHWVLNNIPANISVAGTAAPAHRSERIGIFSSSTRSMPYCPILAILPRFSF